jgi:hypothetical protein
MVTANKMKEHANNAMLFIQQNKATTIKYMTYFIIVMLLIMFFIYTIQKIRLKNNNNTTLSKLYSDFPQISTLNTNDAAYQFLLRDYYIKTAYNCCCGGQFKNDYVDVVPLKKCISQGARVLDFEIYSSLDDKPIIAASSINNVNVKEMYNEVYLEEALKVINNNAFSGGTCPCPNDPLILHFRIQSNNDKMYKSMAETIYNTVNPRLLDKEYSYQYSGFNLGAVPLQKMMGKIIISIDRANPMFETTPLNEYVNMASNSMFLRASRAYDIKFTPNAAELIEYNKKYMTISMPDLSAYDTNIDASLHMKYGVQCIGMCFQNFDSNMEFYTSYFDKYGHSFVLKPDELRYIPVTIEKPAPQDPKLSYASRETKTDFYSFSV